MQIVCHRGMFQCSLATAWLLRSCQPVDCKECDNCCEEMDKYKSSWISAALSYPSLAECHPNILLSGIINSFLRNSSVYILSTYMSFWLGKKYNSALRKVWPFWILLIPSHLTHLDSSLLSTLCILIVWHTANSKNLGQKPASCRQREQCGPFNPSFPHNKSSAFSRAQFCPLAFSSRGIQYLKGYHNAKFCRLLNSVEPLRVGEGSGGDFFSIVQIGHGWKFFGLPQAGQGGQCSVGLMIYICFQ